MKPWLDIRDVQAYWLDAWQRSVLFLDVLRERGNIHLTQASKEVPHVLGFEVALIRDGRTLERPVNYGLVRVIPPAGTAIDPTKPPVIVVDPRAGHGPGIGGMKQESEIGMALAAGHACYFVGFTPRPMPGQTIEDVCRAEAIFVQDVVDRHPDADGKPIVIANCQAGWQIMMMAAVNPTLTGPIMLAGSPLSYWAGVRGKNPLRYLGGVMGGTWATALAGDMGAGVFDGAHLVSNFESLNPANTYWSKAYNVYANIDTERQRFLDFETWWGSPVLLNGSEMQWIADNLFVGNKLSTGQLRTSDGTRIDLRNIRSPIIVFCSWGDNITPPQQALGWVLDLYRDTDDIIADGQTIVYTMHQSIGHLGIFVSGKVATREHGEFVSCMEMINLAPPGLYEAVITEVAPDMANPELIEGRYLFRLEARTLDDLRALGGNDEDDDLRFATAARVSEASRGLYQTMAAPAVRMAVTEQAAEAARALHPSRMRFAMFSDENPFMWPIRALADTVREERKPVAADNPLRTMEQFTSDWIAASLKAYGDARDMLTEAMFLTTYGSPVLQAMMGLSGPRPQDGSHIERDLAREAIVAHLRADLANQFEVGGIDEAVLRALIYVRIPEASIDERGFSVLKHLRAARPAGQRISMERMRELVRRQFLLLRLDEERAVAAIPKLLGDDAATRSAAMAALQRVLAAPGDLTDEGRRRFARIESLFAAAKPAKAPKTEASHA